jgi:adenosine/AMP kinase
MQVGCKKYSLHQTLYSCIDPLAISRYVDIVFSNRRYEMEFKVVDIKKPEQSNVVIGMTHFIKSCEDVYEALVNTVPGIRFGFAFCEASQDRLVRFEGTDEELTRLAAENAKAIGAGHSFVLLLGNAYPINVLKTLRSVPEIVSFFCASANPVQVIVAETEKGRGIVGVIDGQVPLGVEDEEQIRERREFLRKIGYKLF